MLDSVSTLENFPAKESSLSTSTVAKYEIDATPIRPELQNRASRSRTVETFMVGGVKIGVSDAQWAPEVALERSRSEGSLVYSDAAVKMEARKRARSTIAAFPLKNVVNEAPFVVLRRVSSERRMSPLLGVGLSHLDSPMLVPATPVSTPVIGGVSEARLVLKTFALTEAQFVTRPRNASLSALSSTFTFPTDYLSLFILCFCARTDSLGLSLNIDVLGTLKFIHDVRYWLTESVGWGDIIVDEFHGMNSVGKANIAKKRMAFVNMGIDTSFVLVGLFLIWVLTLLHN